VISTARAGAFIFVLCALLRIALVDRQGLWSDEFFSLAMATGHSLEHPVDRAQTLLGDYVETPVAVAPAAYSRYLEHEVPPSGLRRVVRAVFLSDTNPPLYYVLLYGWTRALGAGDAALRLFSVLCSLATFPVFWSLAKRLGGGTAAIAAGILFAVSPLCVLYATEGRMYALLVLCSVGTWWLTLRAWDEGPRPVIFALWVATGVAGCLTHYFFVFVWLGVIGWLQACPGRFRRALSVAGALMTFFLVLPWYIHLPESLSEWRVTGYWLSLRPNGHHPIATPLSLPWSFLSIDAIRGARPLWDWINAAVFLLLAIASVRKLSGSLFSSPRSLLWVWLLSPCLGLVLFDALRGTYASAVPRYALAGFPAACLIVGVVLGHFGRPARALFMALIIGLCAVGVLRLYRADDRSGEPYAQIATLLTREASDSDVILVHSIPSGVAGIARYLERAGASRTGVGFASWVGQLGRRRVPEDLRALAAGRRRIILVRIHDVGEPAPEESWLKQNGRLVETRTIQSGTIQYFVPADSMMFFPPTAAAPVAGR
jgi:uncharacterized membrane protein